MSAQVSYAEKIFETIKANLVDDPDLYLYRYLDDPNLYEFKNDIQSLINTQLRNKQLFHDAKVRDKAAELGLTENRALAEYIVALEETIANLTEKVESQAYDIDRLDDKLRYSNA
jgi:hypothetical protein